MWTDLLKAALTLVVGFLLNLLFTTIHVEVDVAVFNAIVAGFVAWFLILFGVEQTFRFQRFLAKRFKS